MNARTAVTLGIFVLMRYKTKRDNKITSLSHIRSRAVPVARVMVLECRARSSRTLQNLKMLWKIYSALLIIEAAVRGSPFELLENYIENFENSLDHLRTYVTSKNAIHTRSQETRHEGHSKDIGEYDFIIIGAGTSGSVIANRLSENPEWKTLVLEAGEAETSATKVPCMHSCLKSSGSPLTWGYYSTPQNYTCLNMQEKRCFIPTAKAIGGTTAINDMIYTRGNPRDYDLWADTGLKGWCTTSLTPYFKKIEDAHLDSIMEHHVHNYGGPIHLESPRYQSEIAHKLLAAATNIGLQEIDINGKQSLGFGFPQLMTKKGERYSAAEAYISLAKARKNLVIKPLTQATKILISDHTKEARAVQFIHKGELFTASASKEIILAAGAINSAKLLLLSGIGPHEDLEHLKIEPHVDLKVGRNLIHHPIFSGLTHVFNDSHLGESPFYYSKEIDYLRNGRGPLTSTGVDLIGFIKTEHSKGRHLHPDVELLVTSAQIESQPQYEIRHSTDHQKKFTVNLVLLHPKSRGVLELHSNDPHHAPLVHLNDFTDKHDDDIDTLVSAIRTTQKLIKSHPMETLGAHLHEEVVHNCTAFEEDSDEYWKCAIRHLTVSTGEISSSAPMGIDKEGHYGDSVVDLKLRVHGIEKLRVADESVIPVSISGNLAAIKMVIGEKCADLLKEEWSKI